MYRGDLTCPVCRCSNDLGAIRSCFRVDKILFLKTPNVDGSVVHVAEKVDGGEEVL